MAGRSGSEWLDPPTNASEFRVSFWRKRSASWGGHGLNRSICARSTMPGASCLERTWWMGAWVSRSQYQWAAAATTQGTGTNDEYRSGPGEDARSQRDCRCAVARYDRDDGAAIAMAGD